ncbi:hypothetical protein [Mongoliibacter ruber]|uniref:Uncharacterized protein n=1 Tax=Mongoliibacter ruber TaxID=1750599 RepID=A0A2T0WWA1_9BACT|nr:hypothetical protein [Mongoliibacter ruber]PRY90965.1 hypothetical protein CLW00_101641 [Mongoliibacter ruber]
MAIRRKIPQEAAVLHPHFTDNGQAAEPKGIMPECNVLREVRREIGKFEDTIHSQTASSYGSVKKYLGFMDFIAKPAYDKLVKFYSSAAENLVKLEELALMPGADEELRNTLVAITNYLKKENSSIPRTFGGILGQTDRAYIVHAQLMKLNVSKKIKFSDFPHNSTVIFTVVNVLVVILGKQLIGSIANTSDHLTENYLSTDRSFLQQFESAANVSPSPRPRFIEDQMADTAAKLGGFGDINFHQSPSYD